MGQQMVGDERNSPQLEDLGPRDLPETAAAKPQSPERAENPERTATSSRHTTTVRTREVNMSNIKVFGIWFAIVCGVACPFLDEAIIAAAVPQITDHFNSLSDTGVSSYSQDLDCEN